MCSGFRPVTHRIAALITTILFVSTCCAQEVASLDLTKIAQRLDLRRPEATSPPTSGDSGRGQSSHCLRSEPKVGELRTSLRLLDRTSYRLGDEPIFEVQVENTGSTTIRIPFYPHLADLQPDDPTKNFPYSDLRITLWIAAEDGEWSTNAGGGISLYGDDDHAGTMLSLKPGQWVRIVGTGEFSDPRNGPGDELIHLHPVGRVYARAALYREQTLITPTASDTRESREVCIEQTHAQTIPIQLTIP
jgi:hypothetical protein